MKMKEAMKEAKKTGKRVQVTEPEDSASEVKVNVSIRLDLEVLEWLKAEAERQSIPYTTLANALLKRSSQQEPLESRIERLEKALLSHKVG